MVHLVVKSAGNLRKTDRFMGCESPSSKDGLLRSNSSTKKKRCSETHFSFIWQRIFCCSERHSVSNEIMWEKLVKVPSVIVKDVATENRQLCGVNHALPNGSGIDVKSTILCDSSGNHGNLKSMKMNNELKIQWNSLGTGTQSGALWEFCLSFAQSNFFHHLIFPLGELYPLWWQMFIQFCGNNAMHVYATRICFRIAQHGQNGVSRNVLRSQQQ